MPLSAFSSGTLTRLSTSSVDSPAHSVWISTSGGANSGKTSSGMSRTWTDAEDHQRRRRCATTMKRNRRLEADDPAHHRAGPPARVISACPVSVTDLELGAVQLGHADGDHERARLRAGR